MGRTGSRSLAFAIERALGTAHHVHQLLDAEGKFSATPTKDLGRSVGLLRESEGLSRPVAFVTPIRDPIACLLSAQFRRVLATSPEGPPPDGPPPGGWPTPSRLLKKPKGIIQWFDIEFQSALGIDVFEHPFDRGAGFACFSAGPHRFLLLQSELGDDCKSSILTRFLGVRVSVDRDGADPSELAWQQEYRAWLRGVEVPESHLEVAYESRLVRHFYAPHQIEAFRSRWRRSSAAADG